ncbi:hypothetical protein T4D_9735 [Trichinella pseudospiralis]|uniref:Uncharacterized protein n=1 Tax=Trichinella pseudospiralis TaxID=6337 RepID=A0A0V1F9D7_TRIPS|nr:hypothetical protein T4D_9735 [Trichinella pseudospiralis]
MDIQCSAAAARWKVLRESSVSVKAVFVTRYLLKCELPILHRNRFPTMKNIPFDKLNDMFITDDKRFTCKINVVI